MSLAALTRAGDREAAFLGSFRDAEFERRRFLASDGAVEFVAKTGRPGDLDFCFAPVFILGILDLPFPEARARALNFFDIALSAGTARFADDLVNRRFTLGSDDCADDGGTVFRILFLISFFVMAPSASADADAGGRTPGLARTLSFRLFGEGVVGFFEGLVNASPYKA